MKKKTGVKAHKEALEALKRKILELGRKFENGTILDFENDAMDVLSLEIRKREQELRGFC